MDVTMDRLTVETAKKGNARKIMQVKELRGLCWNTMAALRVIGYLLFAILDTFLFNIFICCCNSIESKKTEMK